MQDEAQFYCSDSRAILCSPSQHERIIDFTEATLEVPWVPHHKSRGTQTFRRNLKKTRRFPPQCEVRWGNFPLQSLECKPEFPLEIQKEIWLPLCNSRGSPRYPLQLKNKTEVPSTTQEPCVPYSSRDEGRFPRFNSRGIPTLPSCLKRRPVSPIETWEEPLGSCHNLKGCRVPTHLEIKPDPPVPTRMKPWVAPHNVKGVLTLLLNL